MKYIKTIIFIPSFYGAIFFSLFFLFYFLRVIEYDHPLPDSLFIFTFASISFFISTFLYYSRYKKYLILPSFDNFSKFMKIKFEKRLAIALFLISSFGMILYLKEAAAYYGGIRIYFLILFSDDAWQIRSEGNQFSSSVGIQLTYLGWISASLFLNLIFKKHIGKKWILIILIIILQNLLFLDRTRPSWIFFTLIISMLPNYYNKLSSKKIFFITILFPSVFIFLFISIGSYLGKVTDEKQYNGWDIPPQFQNVVNYGAASFAYFDRMLRDEEVESINLDRTIYPLKKILSDLGISDPPASLVNEYYYIPSPTNVGTFLEPYYRDGGITYIFIGIIIHAFLVNEIGLYFLRNKNSLTLYAYANLCFVNLLSFFTPKLNNFPIWLFILIGFVSIFYYRIKFNDSCK